MRILFILIGLFHFQFTWSQVLLDADGPGETYDLITSVLAPGYDPIEVPDCNHASFGDHIDEVFDPILNTHVFRFFIHTTPDNDRCINFDRQRNEIKTYDKSPENLLGRAGETVVYKWKFKLAEGFQSSPNFTHLHQLKSVGGSLASMPIYTLTARKSNPDRLELRYAETTSQITLIQTPLAPFIDTWLEVTETIKYGISGTYEIKIKQVDTDEILLSYANNSIINWRAGAEFVRPKWGIYRSLLNAQDLRDETILFANFSIEELTNTSVNNPTENEKLVITPNPADQILHLKNLKEQVELIQIFSLEGRKVLETAVDKVSEISLDISAFPNGTYIIKMTGKQFYQSGRVLISH